MFKNRVRLPLKITKPQFPEERTSFRKANGETKTLSVVIRKEYEGETDFLPEGWHQKLKIALAHDNIRIEGDKYLGDIAQVGDYTIEWPDFFDYPTSKAKFKAEVTPFAETNSNCVSCEEASQLDLEDDTIEGIYGALQEGETYEQNLIANDTICCAPATFSVFWYNTDYITSASINDQGVLSVTVADEIVSANGLKIATYRVTCPNGGYDEADVYADFEGSIEGCLAPTDLTLEDLSPNGATLSWTQPFVDASYEYQLFEGDLPVGTPVHSGNIDITTQVEFDDLEADTIYYFQVRTVCESGTSNWIALEFTTPIQGETCGEYTVEINDGSGDPTMNYPVTFINCAGNELSHLVFNNQSVVLCALQNTPGIPAQIIAEHATITYNGLC